MHSCLICIIAIFAACLDWTVQGVAICLDETTNSLYATKNNSCDVSYKHYYSVQLNVFDAWWEWSGVDSVSGPVNATEARKAITDALQNDFIIYRFFAYLFGTTMDIWLNNQTYFWSMYDEYYSFITELNTNKSINNKIYVIPSLGYTQWYELTENETLNDLVTNNKSQSRQLMYKYLNQYITKYKDLECILFWELGNELNLRVDLPPPHDPTDTFTTPQMVQYVEEIVNYIQRMDDIRPISSGYSCPRPAAWHLYYNQSWTIDSEEQWSKMMSWQNQPVDIISCHSYGHQAFFNESIGQIKQFYVGADTAANDNKMFYVGEFGPSDLNYSNPNTTKFVYNAIDSMVDIYNNYSKNGEKSSWILSTIWAWEDYTHGNTLLYPDRESSVPIIKYMHKATNEMMSA